MLITVSGWYTFRHTFRDNAGNLAVDFDILQTSNGATVAQWTIQPGHAISGVERETVTMIGTGLHDGLPVGVTMIAVDYGGLVPGGLHS